MDAVQSFAKIAQASPDRLRSLPGFGPVKVRRLVDAFDKPFRNKATSAVSAAPEHVASSQEKHADTAGIIPANVTIPSSEAVRLPPAEMAIPRSVHSFGSPADMPPTPPSMAPSAQYRSSPAVASPLRVARQASPAWDIENDLTKADLAAAEAQLLIDSPLYSRVASGFKIREGADSSANDVLQRGVESEMGMSKQPNVWDIELDLN